MSYVFYVASSFNQGINGWETSQVRSMSYMSFVAPGFNQGTGGWNTSQVSDTSSFIQGVGGWNTSQASDMRWTRMYLPASIRASAGSTVVTVAQ